jgi:TonB-linked SusC/RagA family outer membrane protein
MIKYASVLIAFCWTCLSLHAQETATIKGSVVDFLSSKPISKTNISIKGSLGVSTESSDSGTFELNVPSAYSVLIISYPGYQRKEFPLNGNKEVSITLAPEKLDIGESVVRLPYFSSNEKNLNGSYSVVSKGYDKSIQYRDIYQMLEGTVPGLEVKANSGVPGEGSQMNLRGIRSLYATNTPLLIVDGVPVVNQIFNNSVVRGNVYNYLADINVKDIESVTVLRDASASGIYGSRASNGALVITTKQGTNGKSFLDVSSQQGVSFRFKEMPVMNSGEYLSYLSSKLYGQGLSQQTINLKYPFFTNTNTNTVDYWTYANNTDWQKEVTRNAFSQDYYFNLRGGDVTSKYSLNVGYNNADGVGKGISNTRFTSRFNLDFRISTKLTAGMRVGFSRTQKNLMDQGNEERTNPLYLSLAKPSIFAPFQKSNKGVDGPFLSQPGFDLLSNPLAVVKGVKNEVLNTWILGSVFAQYELSKAFKTKFSLTLDRKGVEEDRFTPSNGIVPVNNDPRFDRTSEEQLITEQIMSLEHTITFEKQLNRDNRLLAYAGYNIEMSSFKNFYGYTIHSTSDDFQGLGDGMKLAMSGLNETAHNLSVFANIDYVFREKFFIKGGMRLDGSSKFGDQVSDGLNVASIPVAALPYAGITWKVKAEPWMKSLSFIDEFNVRSSWGLTANQNIPVNARYSLYESTFYTFKPGIAPSYIGNPQIHWETTNNINIGTDFSLLNKSLEIKFDYFNTKTTDLLVPKVINDLNGTNLYWDNQGTLKNRGFELGLSTLGHAGDLIWKLGFNIARYTSEVNDLPFGLPIISGTNGFSSIAQNGSAPGLIYGFRNMGVFSTAAEATTSGLINEKGIPYKAGDFHYADLKKDGIINDLDMTVIGDPNPKFFGGITAGFSYKNFDLDAVFTYSYGNDIMNVLRMKMETGDGYENQSVTVLGRWATDRDITKIPNILYGDPAGDRRSSTAYIEDGSYLKMKSLTLSYSIGKQISFMRTAQFYISGYNLFTMTNYLGFDPEVAGGVGVFSRGYDFGNYPQSKMIMVGIKLGL